MWYQTESNVKPELVDTSSSKVYTYIRRNIQETQNEDGDILYTYEEQKIPKAEYATYLANKNAADLAYLYMMEGFDYE